LCPNGARRLKAGEAFRWRSRECGGLTGNIRWFLHREEPLRTKPGEIVKWYGSSIEIEERKNCRGKNPRTRDRAPANAGLRASIVAVFGPNRERLYVNRGALDYLGISLDEWRQRSFAAGVHPDDSERFKTYADRALSTGAAYELEVRLRKSDASYRWFLARYNPVRDNKGQVMRWYFACTDIEDRKQAEDALHREKRRSA